MRSQHDGMSLWYGTTDAPAPEGNIQTGADITITIGVQPIDASNRVELLYRTNSGPTQTIEVRWLRNDLTHNVQYFRTRLPAFRVGDTVEYTVICGCSGRQVPHAEEAKQFLSSFQVVAAEGQHTPSPSTVQNASAPQVESANGSKAQGIAPTTNNSQHGAAMPDSLLPSQHPAPTPIPTPPVTTSPAENGATSAAALSHHQSAQPPAAKPPVVSLRLHVTMLDKSLLELLTTPGEHKAFVSDALNTTLKNKLAGALNENGHTTLANLAQNMDAADLAAHKDMPLRSFVAKQVEGKVHHDEALKMRVDIELEKLSDSTTVGDLLGLHLRIKEHPQFRDEAQKTQLHAVLNTSPALAQSGQQEKLISEHAAHEGTPEEFWHKLREHPDFKTPGLIENLQFTIQLDALTLGNTALMKSLHDLHQRGTITSIRDLVKLKVEDWHRMANESGEHLPTEVPGETHEQRVNNYVNSIINTLHEAFPTAQLAHSLAQPPQVEMALVHHVLAQNPGLDLTHQLPDALNLAGLNDEEQQKAHHALQTLHQEIKAFPAFDHTTALAGGPTVQNPIRQAVSQFLVNQPDFDFHTHHIDTYIAQQKDTAFKGIDDTQKNEVVSQLKRMQRVMRVAPHAEVATKLLGVGFDSAHSIARLPQAVFLQRVKGKLDNETDALRIFAQAQHVASLSLHTFAQIYQAVNDVLPAAIGSHQEIADWAKLFGTLELCDCEHCHSVYSPAAYFVDLLQFLANSPATGKQTPLDTLLERRPDLQYIKLTCENTNTPIPYVDLVNEILETYVAFEGSREVNLHDKVKLGQVIAKNTSPKATTEEIQANPAHTREEAYEKLRKTIYPLALPYHHSLDIIRTYLEHLGTSRYELMKTFQQDGKPTDEAIAYEYLKFSPEEYDILVQGPLSHAHTLAEFYGYAEERQYRPPIHLPPHLPQPPVMHTPPPLHLPPPMHISTPTHTPAPAPTPLPSPPMVNLLHGLGDLLHPADPDPRFWKNWETCLAEVPEFLTQVGISYVDLLELVKTRFLNPGHVDAAHAVAVVLESGALPHDIAPDPCDIRYMKLKNLDEAALKKLHRFVRLWKKLGWSIQELDKTMLALGADDIDAPFIQKLALVKQLREELNVPLLPLLSLWSTIDTTGDDALYHKLFLNRAVIKPTDEAYQIFKLNKDGSNPEGAGKALSEYVSVVLAALRISAANWTQLTTVLPDDALTLKNLSLLYRHAILARALRLSIKNLLVLITLTGRNPFKEHDPAATRAFVDIAQKMRASGFAIPKLNYLYRHYAEPNTGIAPLQTNSEFLLKKTLREGLQKISSDNIVQPDPSGDLLRRKLSMLPDMDSKLVDQAMSIVDGTTKLSAADQGTFIEQQFRVFLNVPGSTVSIGDAKSKLIGGSSTNKEERFAYILTPLINYLITSLSQSLVKQTLSDALKLDASTTDILLRTVVKARIDTSAAVITDFLKLSEKDDEKLAPFMPKVMLSYTLLLKIAMLINAFQFTAQEVTYLSTHGKDFAGFDFNGLPLDTPATADLLVHQWERLYDYVTLRNSLPKGEVGLIDVFGTTSVDDFKARLYDATSWDNATLDMVSGAKVFNITTLETFKQFSTVTRLQTAIQLSKRLGVSADHLFTWAVTPPDAKQAREVKNTVKAKYDDTGWLAVAKALNEAIREHQRDALVAHLLHTPHMKQHQVHTSSQLYEYFLIDVDMSACMLTSRIVQANASIQLFVQRCLMNLESKVPPSAIDDTQWHWMKRYRVWEANRKVFLYPENWIEPGLRDDKSPFFKELEKELLQNDMTIDTAEQAFLNYLNKLDEISRLEISGLFWEEEPQVSPDKIDWRDLPELKKTEQANILHIFARTASGTPHTYYYRQLRNNESWTPWEKVNLDIEGDHLIPVVYNRRIHLFWPMFSEKAPPEKNKPQGQPKDNAPPPEPQKEVEIKLAWSEYKQGKWTAKQTAKTSLTFDMQLKDLEVEKKLYVFKALFEQGDLVIRAVRQSFPVQHVSTSKSSITIPFGGSISIPQINVENAYRVEIGGFRLTGCHGTVIKEIFSKESKQPFVDVITPEASSLAGQAFEERANHQGLTLYTGNFGGTLYLEQTALAKQETPVPTLGRTPHRYSIMYPAQFEQFAVQAPFFYHDAQRTYFATPEYRAPLIKALQNPDHAVLHYNQAVAKSAIAHTVVPSVARLGEPPVLAHPQAQPLAAHAMEAASTAPHLQAMETAKTTAQPHAMALSMPMLAESNGAEKHGVFVPAPPAHVSHGADSHSGQVYVPAPPPAPAPAPLPQKRRYPTDLRFIAFYHPYVCEYIRKLNRDGIPGLLTLENQQYADRPRSRTRKVGGKDIHETLNTVFEQEYDPRPNVRPPFPKEVVDFEGGPFSLYNWELFFHIPVTIATRLSKNQRFEDAQHWFHYIFNPTTSSKAPSPQRYWNVLPFLTTEKERIQDTLALLDYKGNDPEMLKKKGNVEKQVNEWRHDAFSPHAIARLRPIAYQKFVVMHYIDNLISWGDQLFRQDTMESVNEATMLYVLASELLGPRPQKIPGPKTKGDVCYYDLTHAEDPQTHQKYSIIDSFSNVQVQLETDMSISGDAAAMVGRRAPNPALTLGSVSTFLFCIPQNEHLLGYWDTVEDRLFKIRHCMNIEGVVRQLPLFAPPIDPALLVRATAMGIDINSVLNDISSPAPHYRFTYMLQKALELCNDVKAFGAALLSALEKKDAEELAQMRSTHENNLLAAVRDVKQQQIDEAQNTLDGLNKSKDVITARRDYYRDIARISENEQSYMDGLNMAHIFNEISQGINASVSAAHLIPNFDVGVGGWASTAIVKAAFGGNNLGSALQAAASVLSMIAAQFTHDATMASIKGGYDRRWDDWKQQEKVANKELDQVDKQIAASGIKLDIAQKELDNHDLQISNAKAVDDFLHSKYTNKELYDWMSTEVSALFFQSYQLAYDLAKRAEKAFQFERGLASSDYIKFGYWDSLKDGLFAGERLALDLKRLEAAYIEQNRREYEIAKHISLVLHDPMALIALKETGTCVVTLPEALFDMDYPGHYMRRIKNVSLTIPCVTGPYTSVNCTLTLLSNQIRADNNPLPSYVKNEDGDDNRFITTFGAIESIATSTAQNDSGMFEVNFRDERYLPFEGVGVVSTWRIDMPRDCNAFDFETIADVILKISYTAREGGTRLRDKAKQETILPAMGLQTGNIGTAATNFPPQENLSRFFSVKHEFSSDWYRFLHPADSSTTQELSLNLTQERFPFQYRGKKLQIAGMTMFLKLKEGALQNTGPLPTFDLKHKDTMLTTGSTFTETGGPIAHLPFVNLPSMSEQVDNEKWALDAKKGTVNPDVIDDLWIVCQYGVS